MKDQTEQARRQMVAEGVTPEPGEQVWTTEEMQRDFEAIGFLSPFVHVRRRSDGVEGTLKFRGGFGGSGAREYFGWLPAPK